MREYDLIVIGTGSAMNLVDAFLERNPRSRVAVIDKDPPGGFCLTRGCIPTKILTTTADLVRSLQSAASFGVDARIRRIDFSAVRPRRPPRRISTMSTPSWPRPLLPGIRLNCGDKMEEKEESARKRSRLERMAGDPFLKSGKQMPKPDPMKPEPGPEPKRPKEQRRSGRREGHESGGRGDTSARTEDRPGKRARKSSHTEETPATQPLVQKRN